ncbi:hypothetical protein SDRG_16056 [Saprolegnia diclina VS20]|uniref:Transcription elongation factor Eaf N-terminal domain-containing protein n=1 Tax=Saprolegnia diclina (strain VS20) TaxID=1156394 RepID=T0PV29_SAPDV|nr:hypothetical protein SDRG_16056 [Saprolegnia diclina VS20]EQC26106.1 hypothetical protein SDRG_16056 [Saprolegnia diclina VS20]|eukprot:XP_008620473.1 hypothetical protein SDRG_16056 [Saprolegnia diclina VS20]
MATDEPAPGQVYGVDIGSSLAEPAEDARPSLHYCFRYEFQPASVDTSVCGLVTADAASSVTVSVANASGGIQFKGKVAESKDVECILIFDPATQRFTLEKLPWSCTQLRHVRQSSRISKAPVVAPPKLLGAKRKRGAVDS